MSRIRIPNSLSFARMAALIAAGLFVACAALAGYAYLAGAPATPATAPAGTAAPKGGEPIEDFIAERRALRVEEARQLDAIIDDANTSDEVRADAQRQKLNRLNWAHQETLIEGVLRARGFEKVVVTVSSDSANVLVGIDQLTQGQSATILELVARETGLSGGNVKIIPIN
ncbi:MAG: SpoIIIAH-like family protein [Clostridiales bacterium]|nr:SpoIIIAH-like family protein [Clostridiales bacterium]